MIQEPEGRPSDGKQKKRRRKEEEEKKPWKSSSSSSARFCCCWSTSVVRPRIRRSIRLTWKWARYEHVRVMVAYSYLYAIHWIKTMMMLLHLEVASSFQTLTRRTHVPSVMPSLNGASRKAYCPSWVFSLACFFVSSGCICLDCL